MTRDSSHSNQVIEKIPSRKKIPYPALKQERAFIASIDEICRDTIKEGDILPPENTLSFYHGTGWTYQDGTAPGASGQFLLKLSEQEVSRERILANDLSTLPEFIEGITAKFIRQMKELLFQRVAESDGRAGGALSLQGKDPDTIAQDYLNFMRKMDFSIDKEGKVQLLERRMHPTTALKLHSALQSQGAEYHRQLNEVIKQKSDEALRVETLRLARFKRAKDTE
jgi:hypothetical protein